MRSGHLLAIGFFGEGNLGDDAILRGLASALPGETHIIATAGAAPLPRGIHGIKRRGISSWSGFLGALRGARLVIGTGGLLQDWSFEGVTFYALRFLAARLAGKPTALFGAGIGPLRGFAARRLASVSLRGVTGSLLRDGESVELFHELTGREAQRGTDWSWALESSPESGGRINGVLHGARAINVRPWLTPDWQEAATRWWSAEPDSVKIGISARAEDRRLLEHLFQGQPVREPETFSTLLAETRTLREGWAMRYHVLLAMLRAGIPVRAIPYDNKARQLAANAGLPIPLPSDSRPPEPRIADSRFIAAEKEKLSLMKTALVKHWEEAARV